MITNILRNPLARWIAALTALYWLMTLVVSFATMNLLASCLWLFFALGAVFAYADEAFGAVTREDARPTGADHLALGIFLSMSAAAVNRLYSLAFRVTDDIGWLNNYTLVFTFAISTVAAALHVTAPAATRSLPRRRRSGVVLAAALAGAGLAGFLTAWQVKP